MRKVWMLSVAGAVVLAGCSFVAPGDTAESGLHSEPAVQLAPDRPDRPDRQAEAAGQTAAFVEIPLPPGVHVIREGRLDLRVPEESFEERWSRMRGVAAELGGYLSDASVGTEERGGRRYAVGSAVLRIPVDEFEVAIERLSDLGERTSLEVSSRDVSGEYVDLEARLRHWRAVEAFHLGLLERAETVEEALAVQGHLQQIQLNIEQLEGRLRHLQSRTTFATLTVFVTAAEIPTGPDPVPGELAEALEQARQVLVAVFGFLIVAAAAVFPLALVGGAAFLLWRVGRRLALR